MDATADAYFGRVIPIQFGYRSSSKAILPQPSGFERSVHLYTRFVEPIRGGLLSGLVAAFLMLALYPASSWAAFPGANGLIAGVGGRDIFTISPTGGDPTRLTDNAVLDGQPSWSADGRRIVFIRRADPYSPGEVWTMRGDGSDQRQVTHGTADESSPSFSPGGGRIVMTRGWDRRGNIVIVRTDGTDPVRLTSDRWAHDPAFSPNGRRIVFAGRPREESSPGIWVMRRDGTHKRLLAAEGYPEFGHPDYDPDGSHIVFDRLECISHGCDSSVILMRSDGRRKRVFSDIGEEPVFSPNGHRIAAVWVSCDVLTETCNWKLVTSNRDGTNGRVVTPPLGSPSWQSIPAP